MAERPRTRGSASGKAGLRRVDYTCPAGCPGGLTVSAGALAPSDTTAPAQATRIDRGSACDRSQGGRHGNARQSTLNETRLRLNGPSSRETGCIAAPANPGCSRVFRAAAAKKPPGRST